MTSQNAFPRREAKFTNSDNLIEKVWINFLATLWNRTGQGVGWQYLEFDPEVSGSVTPGTVTYTTQTGFVLGFAQVAQFSVTIQLASVGGGIAGNVKVTGLPLSANSAQGEDMYFPVSVGNVNLQVGAIGVMAKLVPGDDFFTFVESRSGLALSAMTVAELTATSLITITGTYLI